MQNLYGYPKPESLYPHRPTTSYTRYVVSRRADESDRERIPSVGNSRSVALGGNIQPVVQSIRQHVFKTQTRSQRLP